MGRKGRESDSTRFPAESRDFTFGILVSWPFLLKPVRGSDSTRFRRKVETSRSGFWFHGHFSPSHFGKWGTSPERLIAHVCLPKFIFLTSSGKSLIQIDSFWVDASKFNFAFGTSWPFWLKPVRGSASTRFRQKVKTSRSGFWFHGHFGSSHFWEVGNQP